MLYKISRPTSFSSVVGQDHVVNVLKNQISKEAIAHAIIVTGIRGTGKTTLAKIIGKALNCDSPNDGEPCGQCQSCKEADKGINVDIIEMDAASNNGVDYMRDLKDSVSRLPIRKKKVYIIDEAHMLSKSAFNALLKTLEEPPEHVVFILATTEPHKIIDTIKSRCQIFRLSRIDVSTIVSRLLSVIEAENIALPEDRVLELVARISDGSMRDALSLFDSLISDKSLQVTMQQVQNQLGLVDNGVVVKLVKGLLSKDVKGLLSRLNHLYKNGMNISQMINVLMDCLKDMMIVKSGAALEESEEYCELLKDTGKEYSMELISVLLSEIQKLNRNDVSRNDLEVFVLRSATNLVVPESDIVSSITLLQDEIKRLKEILKKGDFPTHSSMSDKVEETDSVLRDPLPRPFKAQAIETVSHDFSQDIMDRVVWRYFSPSPQDTQVDLSDYHDEVLEEIVNGQAAIETFSEVEDDIEEDCGTKILDEFVEKEDEIFSAVVYGETLEQQINEVATIEAEIINTELAIKKLSLEELINILNDDKTLVQLMKKNHVEIAENDNGSFTIYSGNDIASDWLNTKLSKPDILSVLKGTNILIERF